MNKDRLKIKRNIKLKILFLLVGIMMSGAACSKPNAERLTAKKSQNSSAAVHAVGKEEVQSTADFPTVKDRYYMILNMISKTIKLL